MLRHIINRTTEIQKSTNSAVSSAMEFICFLVSSKGICKSWDISKGKTGGSGRVAGIAG